VHSEAIRYFELLNARTLNIVHS